MQLSCWCYTIYGNLVVVISKSKIYPLDIQNHLDRGYNIGIRLIDEFLAKSNVTRCADFKETAEVIAKVSLFFSTGCSGQILTMLHAVIECLKFLSFFPIINLLNIIGAWRLCLFIMPWNFILLCSEASVGNCSHNSPVHCMHASWQLAIILSNRISLADKNPWTSYCIAVKGNTSYHKMR